MIRHLVPTLVASTRSRSALWFNAVTFLVSALTIWRLEIPPQPRVAARAAGRRAALGGRRLAVRRQHAGGARAGPRHARGLRRGRVRGRVWRRRSSRTWGPASPVSACCSVRCSSGWRWACGWARGCWRTSPGGACSGSRWARPGSSWCCSRWCPTSSSPRCSRWPWEPRGGIAWVTGYTLLGLEVDDEVRGRTFAFLQSAARVVLVLVLAAGPGAGGADRRAPAAPVRRAS